MNGQHLDIPIHIFQLKHCVFKKAVIVKPFARQKYGLRMTRWMWQKKSLFICHFCTFFKHLYRSMYVFSLSVLSNARHLSWFQAEIVKRLLSFEARRKTEEELNTKVTFICETYIRTRVCLFCECAWTCFSGVESCASEGLPSCIHSNKQEKASCLLKTVETPSFKLRICNSTGV